MTLREFDAVQDAMCHFDNEDSLMETQCLIHSIKDY